MTGTTTGTTTKQPSRHDIVQIDLIGELDPTMSRMLDQTIRLLDSSLCATIVIRLEGLESTQWAGLCDLGAVIAKHRESGVDIRADSRLQRVRAVLDELAVPTDVPKVNGRSRRRMIIARTPNHAAGAST